MNNEQLENLAKARAKKQAMREAGIETPTLNPYQKSIANPRSLTQALKATCFGCMGRGEGARMEIATCSSYGCPLWPHRPYQSQAPAGFGLKKRAAAVAALEEREHGKNPVIAAAKDTTNSKRKAATAYCYDCMGGMRDLIATCKSVFPVARDTTDNPYCGCPLWPHRPWKNKRTTTNNTNPSEVAV